MSEINADAIKGKIEYCRYLYGKYDFIFHNLCTSLADGDSLSFNREEFIQEYEEDRKELIHGRDFCFAPLNKEIDMALTYISRVLGDIAHMLIIKGV